MANTEPAEKPDPNSVFYEKAERAMRELFEKARATQELHFAMALMPEFRGMQDAGWNTAEEALNAFDQFMVAIENIGKDNLARVRVVLALYLHAAESGGFYEVPKKMLLTIENAGNNIMPFNGLVREHRLSGQKIAPNANAVMQDLAGHASELGLTALSEVFRDAFDPDVRNAIGHADYILVPQGMRLRKRNGGDVRLIPWDEFDPLINRGLGLFQIIRHLSTEYQRSYESPKTIKSRMHHTEPVGDYTIYADAKNGAFGFTTGKEPPKGFGK